MSNYNVERQIKKNHKVYEVEAKVVNSSFDHLFTQERTGSERRSKSLLLDKHDATAVRKELKENEAHNMNFYANILTRAKLLLQRKDPKGEAKGEQSKLTKTNVKHAQQCSSEVQNNSSKPTISRSQSARATSQSSSSNLKKPAELLTNEILEVQCNPMRLSPGRLEIQSPSERVICGLDCDQVLPGVILASGKAVKNFGYMSQLRVTHIINTASRDVWLPAEKLTNLGVEMFQFHVDDVPSANIAPYFRQVAEFVAKAKQAGGLLVINCLVGLSRSATALTAALMINNKWTAKRALQMLRKRRPVKPNLGFMVQLLALEMQLLQDGIKLV